MNNDKFEKKIAKKYGVNSSELKSLSLRQIKNLQINKKRTLQDNEKFKLVKKPVKAIVKGATIGASVAGVVNTVFPNLVPVAGTYLTTSSSIPNQAKLAILTFLASLPVDLASGYTVLGIGAGIGSLAYSGYKLVKIATNNLKVISDRGKAKKLNRGK